MREIIIDCKEKQGKTIAFVENGKLIEKYEEEINTNRIEGNIYLGIIEDILPGMQSAFIDIGAEKNTFIHIRDIIPKASNQTGNKEEELSKYNIRKYIKTGEPVIVQVKRDSTMRKGARVSTHITLAGRFVVFMPQNGFITVSQKIENIDEKTRLIEIVKEMASNGDGFIVRTAAIKKSKMEIQKEIKMLKEQWEKISKQAQSYIENKITSPKELYRAPSIIQKFINDVIDQKIDRIIVNNKTTYEEINSYIKSLGNIQVQIEYKNEDILTLYDIHQQIEKLKNRKIWLKCGGFITIDKTEALTAIDVNSGKYIGKQNLEQTVLTVNKEATIEIAKQIKLRDIGGIIIIDYIDMEQEISRKQVSDLLEEQLKKDRSKTQIIGFTPLNLLEMTRKHIYSNS